MAEYVGVLHVHTTLSDGDDTPQQTIAAAIDAGLDFLVISDHSSDDTRQAGLTGRHGRLLCISAPEIGIKGAPHFVSFGGAEIEPFMNLPPTAALETSAGSGQRNIIAHPHSARMPMRKSRPVDWEDWETPHFCGMEIWSYLHDLCDHTVPWGAPLLMWTPKLLVRGPRRETLQVWDRLTQQRRVAGVAALDNHARRLVIGTIVPHRHAFRALRTHVVCDSLPGDAAEAERQLVEAMCSGSGWAAMDQWADSRGLEFEAHSADGRRLGLGQEAPYGDGWTLHVRVPRRADLVVIHDGQVLEMHRDSDGFDLPLRQSGVYRLEASLGRRAWILTNPVYLRDRGETGAQHGETDPHSR